MAGLPGDLLIAGVLVTVAAACLRAPVSRWVLALLAIPVIPYAVLWPEKLAGDLFRAPAGASAIIPSSLLLLYLPPLILACVIVGGTRLARRRASASGGLHDHLRGTPGRLARVKPKIVVAVVPGADTRRGQAIAGAGPPELAIGVRRYALEIRHERPGNQEMLRSPLTIP
ncbi:MAG: hypothetical protein ACRDNT_25470 [Streptosporangiaceae bacterium]